MLFPFVRLTLLYKGTGIDRSAVHANDDRRTPANPHLSGPASRTAHRKSPIFGNPPPWGGRDVEDAVPYDCPNRVCPHPFVKHF